MARKSSAAKPSIVVGAFATALCINSYIDNKMEDDRIAFHNEVDQAAKNLLRRKIQIGAPLVTADGRSIGYIGSVKNNVVSVPIYTEALPLRQRFELWAGSLSCQLQNRASAHGMILHINRRSEWRSIEVNQYCAPPRYVFTQSFLTASVRP